MSDKRYMACPQCGQNMNLSPNATDELDELKSRNAVLEKKVEKLREALKPFSDLDIDDLENKSNLTPVFARNDTLLLLQDFLNAKAALSDGSEIE